MDRVWKTPSQVPLLAALVLHLAQAQSFTDRGEGQGKEGPTSPPRPLTRPCSLSVAQRKPWLVVLGAVLALLFLIFVLTLVYAVCSRESSNRWACSPVCTLPSL